MSTVTAATAVPFLDLQLQHAEVIDDIREPLLDAISRAEFIGGPQVAAFEAEYAVYCEVRNCVGVGNGTDAIELALRALDIGKDHEVVVPANTFIATAEAVARAGATVRLADVDDDTLLLDPGAAAGAVTPRTAAIIPVHLYGQTAPVEQFSDTAPTIIEDAAQSQGARRHGRAAGSLGTIAATSFYPGKNLGAAGDAGAVLTDDDGLARRVRRIADHGSSVKYVHDEVGFNSRLDAIQAIVLRAKLARLEGWNEARREAAKRYDELLSDLPGVRTPTVLEGNLPVWHIYAIRVQDRDRILAGLRDAGIGASLHYPTPVHLTGAFRSLGYAPGDFPVAERAAGELLSLPMFPQLTEQQQVKVAEALRSLV
ncbi:DegT/DnrJ/EryC1/StrS family aminotransferase [Cryobacterium sp. BB736]|uniref:DegT/DnrJ/EryC1/StrS family aminotransferase n=1 Tax=Cryobacterium sp. BB736 TaxID=2746963 RepID=UPI00187461EB